MDTSGEIVKRIIVVAVCIAVLILGYFYLGLKHQGQTHGVLRSPGSDTITLVHSFKDGVHRYSGALKLPHSCYSVATDIIHDPKNPNNLLLNITTKENSFEKNSCLNIPTPFPFEVIAEAAQAATVKLNVNGEGTTVTLVETEWQNPRGTVLNLENL